MLVASYSDAVAVLVGANSSRVPCLSPAPTPVRLVFYGPWTMKTWWILALAGGRAPFLDAFLSFVRVCVNTQENEAAAAAS